MIILPNLLSIMNPTEVRCVHDQEENCHYDQEENCHYDQKENCHYDQEENCHYDHIPLNLKVTSKQIAIRRTAAPKTGFSRHNGGSIEGLH